MELPEEGIPDDIQRIISAAVMYLRVRTEDVCGLSRKFKHFTARQIICWIARRDTGYTYQEIARCLGGKKTSTAKHADDRAEERRRRDRWFQETLDAIRDKAASM